MGRNNRCCVGTCDNDQRYLSRLVIKPHVKSMKWHRFPTNPTKIIEWTKAVSKGRENFQPGKYTYVCSNHFVGGDPNNQSGYGPPTLYLTPIDERQIVSQTRPAPKLRLSSVSSPSGSEVADDNTSDTEVIEEAEEPKYVPMLFSHITREYDVRFFTGIPGPKLFKSIFELMLEPKAKYMCYWEGVKSKAEREKRKGSLEKMAPAFGGQMPDCTPLLTKRGPSRKLTLEQEFLMVMMRLRLDLLTKDLAFRFGVADSRVTQTLITWVKLMSKQLGCLIIWPSRGQIYRTLPSCFKRLYPDTRCIIDCTEVFIERPSSLDSQSQVWSDYKGHCTFKFLVAITPNGAVSWVSSAYGGRATDIHIVRDSGFLDLLEPFDRVMADRGFKIKTDLAMHQCYLSIPPSAAKGSQMTGSDVRETSRIANVRIFVEQAIKRMKEFRILKGEVSILELPLVNDYIIVCAALSNLFPPLTN